ncbi:MAG: hypothetical protein OSJ46_06795 [Duncaniella sp.]|nr:hypothetical protein [Duncaniella sp.]HBI58606.1 hypothetical protein [Porphyromonadaceae bacterium]
MKAIQKKSTCQVSDRAYRIILTNCINVMTEKGVSADIFAAVIMAVKEYLETGQLAHRMIQRVRNIFDLFRADIDLAIRRAASARKAAMTRRKKSEPETVSAEILSPKKQKPAKRFYSFPVLGALESGETPKPPRRSKGIRCPGLQNRNNGLE